MMRDRLDNRRAAVLLSIALQYGAPADVIRRALCRTETGEAEGLVGAVLDFLAETRGVS